MIGFTCAFLVLLTPISISAQGGLVPSDANLSKQNEYISMLTGPGDVNGDGFVDVLDILLVLAAWGQTGFPGWIPEDQYHDGIIDVLDLLIVLQYWT